MKSFRTRRTHRRGIAMILVLGLSMVLLALGTAMLTTSGHLLSGSVDARQQIRARYAAESMVSLSIAQAVEKANEFFGAALEVDEVPMGSLGTPNGERGESEVQNRVDPNAKLAQEKITSGRLAGMMGLKIPLLINATGLAPGGAKSRVDADVRLYQVPIFQFGVFYEGNLEISPGPDMYVFGPVHTNSNAHLRGMGTVTFQGPVSASGTIYHWRRLGTSGSIRYLLKPDTSAYRTPALTNSLTALDTSTQPWPIAGVRNVEDHRDKLVLPIGGSQPRNLLAIRDPSDPPSLRFQKFDWKVPETSPARFVNGITSSRPTWITGPRVFFDRREDRWVKVWDFDMALFIASGRSDSIFYLADTVLMPTDTGTTRKFLLNAFRIVNATYLPRNMSIASANPIYIQGDFNLANPSGSCRRAQDTPGSVPADQKYCNAQIAADAITLLSPNWPNLSRFAMGAHTNATMSGSLEQSIDTNAYRWTNFRYRSGWDTTYSSEPTTGAAGTYSGSIRVNAAIFTGNKPSRASALPPSNYDGEYYENNYEGGWHNTIRFLENLSSATVTFNGSFVCMWKAATRGLDTSSSTISIKGGHYNPPTRNWGFDPRFKDLNNMPPGTPFLATAIFTNWIERR